MIHGGACLKQLTTGSLFHLHRLITVNYHSVFDINVTDGTVLVYFTNCKFIATFDKFGLCTSRLDLMGYIV